MIAVRRATPEDAPAMSAVLVASIRELCEADHHGNSEILARWLANKTPDGVSAWFGHPANTVLVAERHGEIAAAGAFNTGREVILNYVSPRHRFAGASTALLSAIEAMLGPGSASLTSTATAHRFYLARGWSDAGSAEDHWGMMAYPMRKLLA